mmetsp:Transcript_24142/g.60446  ORF Transcript_24142/g.60446 Transcript_24142/m.60446 type:complete len:262 (-) Transcript_24142:423-1208(-)
MQREVLLDLVVVHTEVLFGHSMVIGPVPGIQVVTVTTIAKFGLLQSHQCRLFLNGQRFETWAQIIVELFQVLQSLGHTDLEHKVCKGVEAHLAGEFVAKLEHLLHDLCVALLHTSRVAMLETCTNRGIFHILEAGQYIGILHGHLVEITLLAEALQKVIGHTGELLTGEQHSARIFVQVLLELDAELREPLLDGLHLFALLGRQCETGPLEVAQHAFHQTAALGTETLVRLVRLPEAVHRLEDILTHAGLDQIFVQTLLGL